jgi:hypothetical protein
MTRRTWTPDQIVYEGNPRERSVKSSEKRACNKCGTLLGDLTETEMVAAYHKGKRPFRPVDGECPVCQGHHVLFAKPEVREHDWKPEDGDQWTIEVLCPGKPAGADVLPCATWLPCACTPPTEDPLTSEFQEFLRQPCPTSPTGEHRHLAEAGFVGAPTGGCWFQESDHTPDQAAEIATAPGLWPVHAEVWDETTPVFTPVDDGSQRDATPVGA